VPMRGRGRLLVVVLAAGCLTIPPRPGSEDAPTTCTPGSNPADADCDGWVATSPNPAANDCNDADPTINPGALDVPGGPDQDCIGGDSPAHLPGVNTNGGTLTTTDLSLEFNSTPKMPSSMVVASVEALGGQVACTTLAEEEVGVSLYPALAVHAGSSIPSGDLAFERAGPVAATASITWTSSVPATGDPSCDTAVVIAANIRFTVLPGGRLVRDDRITIDSPSGTGTGDTCTGCAQSDNPFFTSYFTLAPSYDRYQIGSSGSDVAFSSTPDEQPAMSDYRVCVHQSVGSGRLGFTWRFAAGDAGPRFRQVPGSMSSAVIYDWVRGLGVPEGGYQAVTALFAQDTSNSPCSPEMWETMDEFAAPASINGLRFVPETGLYVPETDPPTSGRLEFDTLGTVQHGFGVRVSGLGSRGVTVWRKPSPGAAFVRRAGGTDYLIQYDTDDTYTVWFPTAASGEYFAIAGPGAEPPP